MNGDAQTNVKEMVSAFRQFIGGNAMMAYLVIDDGPGWWSYAGC